MEIDEWVGVYGEATKGAGERERERNTSATPSALIVGEPPKRVGNRLFL